MSSSSMSVKLFVFCNNIIYADYAIIMASDVNIYNMDVSILYIHIHALDILIDLELCAYTSSARMRSEGYVSVCVC